jgi:hypothetical protein
VSVERRYLRTAWSRATHTRFDQLVVDDRSDFLFRLFIIAGEKIVELRGSNDQQGLSAPKRVIGLRQLLATATERMEGTEAVVEAAVKELLIVEPKKSSSMDVWKKTDSIPCETMNSGSWAA